MKKEFWITRPDNVEIYIKKWYQPNTKPIAIIQLAHGMAEHINRYNDFASFLVKKNFFVYGNDHRGHGKTGERQGLLGYLADKEGFNKTTDDLHEITKQIKQEYPTVPLFLFGHSMGSFLARKYIQNYSAFIDGIILSGTGYYTKATTRVGMMLAKSLPPTERSHLMNTLVFSSYNKNVRHNKTGFDWLTRDETAVQTYLEDPHAGFVPTARFFHDLMDGLGQIHNKRLNNSIRHELPMLFISGDADPVGDYAKGIWKTSNYYESIGLNKITTMFFENARHELLHEVNKDEVYVAVYDWITQNL